MESNAKVSFLIAHLPIIRIDHSALQFISWHTYSLEHHIEFSGKYSAMLQVMYKKQFVDKYLPLCLARHSLIQLGKLKHRIQT